MTAPITRLGQCPLPVKPGGLCDPTRRTGRSAVAPAVSSKTQEADSFYFLLLEPGLRASLRENP